MASKFSKLLYIAIPLTAILYLLSHLLVYIYPAGPTSLSLSSAHRLQLLKLSDRLPHMFDEKKNATIGQNTTVEQHTAVEQNTTLGSYMKGKRFVYAPITGCKSPRLLEGYSGNPCWKYNDTYNNSTRITCAPKVVVLGIHKCGTTDLGLALNGLEEIINVFFIPYFPSRMNETSYCPTDLYTGPSWDQHRDKCVGHAKKGLTVAMSSGGCFNLIRIVEKNPDHYLVRSCVQMLTFYQSDETRYIITLRNPTERMISHYFYFQWGTNFYDKVEKLGGLKTPESIGFDVLHEVVESTLKEMEECFHIHGLTGCIFFYGPSYPFTMKEMFLEMIVCGCYSVFMEEIVKFIPQERLYVNMLEEYAEDESKAMVKISEFIGLNSSKYSSGNDKESQVVRNKGANQKPVHKKTVELLDKFYQPFNHRMAEIMEDNKWLYNSGV